MCCCFCHPPGSAARTESSFFAAECHQHLVRAIGTLSPQKSVRQNPTAQILFELFVHKIWQWIPQVAFHLLQERQPVALDQLVECSFFGFVALVVIRLGIGYRHRQTACLQQPWPFRIALPTSALVVSSGTPPWLGDSVQRVQIGEPFGPWLNSC